MGVIISLRDSDEVSYYKEMIMGMIDQYHPDELLISSGYFQEVDAYNVIVPTSYNITRDTNFNGDRFIDLLATVSTITIVGVKDTRDPNYATRTMRNGLPCWQRQFDILVQNLRTLLPNSTINAYSDTTGSWHAKETILLCDNIPVSGALGSSNFTRPAFGHDLRPVGTPQTTPINHTINNHNRETDVYLFNELFLPNARRTVQAVNENGETVTMILTTIDTQTTGGRTETDILREQYNLIMRTIVNPPFVAI